MIEKIANDLQAAFPHGVGFSPRNLRNMKQFVLAYSTAEFWQQAVPNHQELQFGNKLLPNWRRESCQPSWKKFPGGITSF